MGYAGPKIKLESREGKKVVHLIYTKETIAGFTSEYTNNKKLMYATFSEEAPAVTPLEVEGAIAMWVQQNIQYSGSMITDDSNSKIAVMRVEDPEAMYHIVIRSLVTDEPCLNCGDLHDDPMAKKIQQAIDPVKDFENWQPDPKAYKN